MGPDTWEWLLRLGLSALLGGIIGLERETRLKGVGIRTHLIVSFAACMMMLVSKYGFFDMLSYETVKLDPSRIAAGLVAAVGFLGAGTIFSRKHGVTGLSTAAGLWATVGVGMSSGAGLYLVAGVGTVFIVVVQHALHREHDVLGSEAVGTIVLQIDDTPEALDCFQKKLADMKLAPSGAKYERRGGLLSVELQIDTLPTREQDLAKAVMPLMKEPYVRSLIW